MITEKINVKGMSCHHCENAVKGAVEALKGVKSATASAKEGCITVVYDEKAVARDQIIKAITAEDFPAE